MDEVLSLTMQIVKSIVAYPDNVLAKVETEQDENGEISLVLIKVHDDDVGLMLGAQGETARALRKIVSLFGYRMLDKRVYVKIVTKKMREQYNSFDL